MQLECVGIYENLLQKAVWLGIMLVIRGCDTASTFLISKGLEEASFGQTKQTLSLFYLMSFSCCQNTGNANGFLLQILTQVCI